MKILTVVGARPQFVKAAPVSQELQRLEIDEVIVHTGQHFDRELSELFFSELSLPHPAYNLEIREDSHARMIGKMLMDLEAVILQEEPEVVLIYGDTNSTLAGALAAAKTSALLAHIEAGLRSFNRSMPEEINRVVSDHLSDLLLCPTTTAQENLRKEGIHDGVHLVGDVMYDAVLLATQNAEGTPELLDRLNLNGEPFALATVHRAENTDNPERLNKVLSYLKVVAMTLPLIFPMHPRTRKAVNRFGLDLEGLITTEPVGYLDMTRLLRRAEILYTDSGGLQKEAYFHRVPCVTLRDETEWIETIECGWNRLWTTPSYAQRREIPEYGDGRAAARITEVLIDLDP